MPEITQSEEEVLEGRILYWRNKMQEWQADIIKVDCTGDDDLLSLDHVTETSRPDFTCLEAWISGWVFCSICYTDAIRDLIWHRDGVNMARYEGEGNFKVEVTL